MEDNETQILYDDDKTSIKITLNPGESPSETTAASFSPNLGDKLPLSDILEKTTAMEM